MSKLIQKGAKFVITIYLVILALSLLLACFFMTQYNEIHIFSQNDPKNGITYSETDIFYVGGPSNDYIFRYFDSKRNKDESNPFYEEIQAGTGSIINNEYKDGLSYAQFIDEYRKDLNQFNESLVVFGVVTIALCALLYVFANHSRRIYYSSNLIAGVAIPLGIGVYSIVMLLNNIGLQGVFNSNIDLFRVTNAMITSEITNKVKGSYMGKPDPETGKTGWELLCEATSDLNDFTFNLTNILFITITIVSVLLVVYTVLKYKATSKRRLEVIERAVQNND